MKRELSGFFIVLLFLCSATAKENGVIEIYPAWSINPTLYYLNEKSEYYSIYPIYFQRHILTILNENGIPAIPSLYNSSMHSGYNPGNLEDLQVLLKKEVSPPYNSLGFLPIIHDAKITYHFKRYSINLTLSIYITDGVSIKDNVFKCNIGFKNWYDNSQQKEIDFNSQLSLILDELRKKDWSNVLLLCREFMKNHQMSLPMINEEYPTGQPVHFFGQSQFIVYNPETSWISRIKKTNGLILDINDFTKRLTFDFDIAYETPLVQYVYLIQPDLRIVQVQPDDIHIQQAPEALPTSQFTGKRYLVVNLPGVRKKSIVCYSIRFNSLQSAPGDYQNQPNYLKESLARDVFFNFSNDTIPWQLRIFIPYLNNQADIYHECNNLTVSRHEKTMLGKSTFLVNSLHNIFFYYGMNTPVPPTIEPSSYVQLPILRISNVNSWYPALSYISKSIDQITAKDLMPKLIEKEPLTQKDTIDYIHQIQKFISDSLHYMHESYYSHKTIPYPPDSTLKRRSGDCKDFTVLLISQLSRAGIKAFPALTNLNWPDAFFSKIPSYEAANHMIAYVPQYQFWIDPTSLAVYPWVTPEHLIDHQAIILYEDSAIIEKIKPSPDSVYLRLIEYVFSIVGKDLKCRYLEKHNYQSSQYIKKAIDIIDSAKIADILFPAESFAKRYSMTEELPVLTNLSDSRVEIERKFTAKNTVFKITDRYAINLPEIPLNSYINLFSVMDRKHEFYFPTALVCRIKIKIEDKRNAVWNRDILNSVKSNYMVIKQEGKNNFLVSFNIKKGLKSLDEYSDLKNAFETYRDLFSTPILLK